VNPPNKESLLIQISKHI